ncbi:hypothetical protein H4R18_000419 [Coemansia javaensis]|uniref:Uncharacterized protein n=1 Tax=Coemansia javaensis TaxID=2761396 RepID=A0A9W8LMU8_9FUNG|nr:hypothetical protein H4R18_000419 [Coemansia javaensis]
MAATVGLPKVALRASVAETFDACITSYNEWCHLHRVLARNPECAEEGERLLYTSAIIDVPLGSGSLALASNIPYIIGNGHSERVRYLVVHAATGPGGPGAATLYRELGRLICELTAMPLRTTFASAPLTYLLGALGRLVEVALFAMPNLRGVLVSRIGGGSVGQGHIPAVVHRHVTYCASVGRVPQRRTLWPQERQHSSKEALCIAPGRDTCFQVTAEEKAPLRPLRLSTLDLLYEAPPPLALLRKLEGYIRQPAGCCTHSMPCGATAHIRRHLHFSPGVRFKLASGDVGEFDWCRIVMDEALEVGRNKEDDD